MEICANVPCCVACCAVCEMRKDVIILKMNNAVCRWAKRFRLKNHTFWSELSLTVVLQSVRKTKLSLTGHALR